MELDRRIEKERREELSQIRQLEYQEQEEKMKAVTEQKEAEKREAQLQIAQTIARALEADLE